MKIKIGGREYELSYDERPCANDVCVDGEILYDLQTIKIRSNLGKEYTQMVIIHEILHGIFNQMCIKQDEEIIEKLANGISEVVINNPNLIQIKI